MKLQLGLISVLMLCGSLTSQPAYVKVRQVEFFEWLISIWLPTTTPAPITTSTSTSSPAESECPYCRCGLINTLNKIVGGQETSVHAYPWLAVILLHQRFYCAGSLISDLYVLTVAHCVEGVPIELITVRFLEHNRSHSHELVVERQVMKVKTHELYNSRSFENDLALLRLERPVEVQGYLRPICLPVPGHSFEGELALVTGWGAQREGGFATDSLQQVEVVILTQSECRWNSTYKPGQITDNMLCAGYLQEGGKDACSGDSGGPLQVLYDGQPGQYQLAGLVSWGEGCARPHSPGVYTRVNQYLRWIVANTPDACLCQPHPE